MSGKARVSGEAGIAWGRTLGHDWTIVRRYLHYGCEGYGIEHWREYVADLCMQYGPGRAEEYERAIRALIALHDAMFWEVSDED